MNFKFLKSDAISGFLVFLIALPLCLGIAKASGFPPIAGIYTAVIGGLIVTFMSNAQLAIKGPAAGLIVIALGAVDELGKGDTILGYKLTLAVIVISGIFQVLLGFLKAGKLGNFFPVSVIHGMLAAIGVIIISKQIHVLMGVVPDSKAPFDLLAEIPKSILNLNPEVALIGFFSLAVLFIHPLIKNNTISKLPAPLLVLAFAIPMGFLFDLSFEHDYDLGNLHYHIDPKQLLVRLPDDFFAFTTPDFSQITSFLSIKYIIMFALVGSIESILSAKAVDTLDPEGRKTNMNRDLIAVGIGNTFTGFIGGLPMISEIVRSSANINNGAKTRLSNFFHGLFLFLFVILAASIIRQIPNAALSAMLVYTGFKLASPKEFKKVFNIGYTQFVQFLVTLIVTLFTDLLIGVIVGIVLKIILELVQGVKFKQMFNIDMAVKKQTDDCTKVAFKGVTSFINFLKFKPFIDGIPRDSKVILDFSSASYVDHTFLHNINEIQNEFSREGGELIKTGFENHHFQSVHHLSTRKTILNPYISTSSNLSKRQTKLIESAESFGLDFERNASSSLIRPYLSPFSILSKFKRAKSFLIGSKPQYNSMVCDLYYDSVDDFTKVTSTATIAVLYNIEKGGIPEFYTQEKSVLLNLSSRYGFELYNGDISFPFDLYSKNNKQIDDFFSPELIELIESSGYTVECKRRVFLIHKNWVKIPEGKQYDEFLEFLQLFADIIIIKRV